MVFSKLNPDVLRELIKLSELRCSLQKQLNELDVRLAALASGKASSKGIFGKRGPGRPPGQTAKRGRPTTATAKIFQFKTASNFNNGSGRRGELKTKILHLLSSAGPEGISVKDISTQLNVKNQNVHVWFSTTGKKLPEILKVGEARYAFHSGKNANFQPEA